MTNEELLEKIRAERPNQVINKVLSFEYNKRFKYWDVKVDMQTTFFETTILHTHYVIPYPLKAYLKAYLKVFPENNNLTTKIW